MTCQEFKLGVENFILKTYKDDRASKDACRKILSEIEFEKNGKREAKFRGNLFINRAQDNVEIHFGGRQHNHVITVKMDKFGNCVPLHQGVTA